MTSAPIMWFTTCDYEFEKDEETLTKKIDKGKAKENTEKEQKFLLKNPELYEIGPNKECFSYKLLL